MANYAVLRNGKLALSGGQWGGVGAANRHNQRLGEIEEHIDKSRSPHNNQFIDGDLVSNTQKRLAELGVSPKRKDQVVLREAMLTTSPEYWGNDWQKQIDTLAFKKQVSDWAVANVEYFKEKYGAENVVGASLHLDEQTPHLHIEWLPLYEKDGVLELNAYKQTSRQQLREMQTDYAKCMAQFGLERGRDAAETKAKHKHYAVHKAELLEKVPALESENRQLKTDLNNSQSMGQVLKEKSLKVLEQQEKKIRDLQEKNAELTKENESLKTALDFAMNGEAVQEEVNYEALVTAANPYLNGEYEAKQAARKLGKDYSHGKENDGLSIG